MDQIPRAAEPVARFPIAAPISAPASKRELRLTGLAIWRGVVGVYNSEDLTFASSIAYYALLSLFPFFLLVFSVPRRCDRSRLDRTAMLGFVLTLLPAAVRVRYDAARGRLQAQQRANSAWPAAS